MTKAHSQTIYEQLVGITADYLGPAARRFIDRQIQNHLGKQPSELTSKDMVKLLDWMKVSIALLTEDRLIVTEFVSRITDITLTTQQKHE